MRTRWLPFFSFLSLFFLTIVVASCLFGQDTSNAFIVAFGVISSIFAFFPQHTTSISGYWSDDILPKAHATLIVLALGLIAFFVAYFRENYTVVIQRKPQ